MMPKKGLATKEAMQLRWDELLIQARFFCPDTSLFTLEVNFKILYGEWPYDFGLLRARSHMLASQVPHISVLRFICAHLPKIANYCWKFKSDKWLDVLKAVNKSNHDTHFYPVDVAKKAREGCDLASTKKSAAISANMRDDRRKLFESYRLSNQWGVCK